MSEKNDGPLRWGIISCGKISHDFLVSIAEMTKPKDHRVVAAAARKYTDAQAFVKLHKIPKAYQNYEELFNDPEVEIVYIGTIHPFHLELGKKALDAGKHVLVEKPLCINVRETKELLEYAKAKNLFLAEALWVRHFPAYRKLQEIISEGLIGEVKQVLVSFGVQLAHVDRCSRLDQGGGTTLDTGIYCTQLAQLVFGGEKPIRVQSTGVLNEFGADSSSSVTLTYSGGRMATFVTSYNIWLPNEAHIVGINGSVKMHNPFWSCTKLELSPGGEIFEYPLPKEDTTGDMKMNFWNTMGLAYQCKDVKEAIRNGRKESSVVTHEETLMISEILEDIRKQIGVVYPQDSQ